ncbi:MAG TPA: hypothetical protein VFW07_03450 [Parafilimonas sp.]|nr:hypothetical protein [Parafilimonas sp.]
MVTVIMTLKEILQQRMAGKLDLADFVEAVQQFAEETENHKLIDAVAAFDELAEIDITRAEEIFGHMVRFIAERS